MPRGRPRKNDSVLLKSAEIIGWALGGIEREIAQTRERLSALNDQAARLRTRLGRGRGGTGFSGASDASGAASGPSNGRRRRRRRRRMSPEARKRISEMMKKRWAERRKRSA